MYNTQAIKRLTNNLIMDVFPSSKSDAVSEKRFVNYKLHFYNWISNTANVQNKIHVYKNLNRLASVTNGLHYRLFF